MKAGIVGLGARAGNVSRMLRDAMPELDFVAYADPNPAGITEIETADRPALRPYEALEEMLAAEKPEFLLIGTPNLMHLDNLRVALNSDVTHIFCEKPVVISEGETFELLDLMARNGGAERVMVGLVLRYAPLYRALRSAMAERQLGDVVSIEAAEHIGPYHGAFFMKDWRRETANSGGFMLEKCCHDIDLYNGVAGSRPARIASFGGRRSFVPANRPAPGVHFPEPPRPGRNVSPFIPRWGGIDDAFSGAGDIIDYQTAMVEYQNGVALSFHTNLNAPDEYRRFAVFGTKGMAEGDFNRNQFAVHAVETGECLADRSDLDEVGAGHAVSDKAMVADVVAHMRHGTPLPVSVIEALVAGLTALKMDEARIRGKVIDMTETWAKFDSYGLIPRSDTP